MSDTPTVDAHLESEYGSTTHCFVKRDYSRMSVDSRLACSMEIAMRAAVAETRKAGASTEKIRSILLGALNKGPK